MFKSNWSESKKVSKKSPGDVILEEDNARAMRTICSVIHHLNDDVLQPLTPEEIFEIAIVADKYNFIVALRYASAEWLKAEAIPEMVDMGYLMVSAYLFAHKDKFESNVLALIMDYTDSYMDLLSDERITQFLPATMFRKDPILRLCRARQWTGLVIED
jgi:hypothetical protein